MKSNKSEDNEYIEILDMVVTRITEHGIREQRDCVPEIDTLIKSKTTLSVDVKRILNTLDSDSRETLTQFYEQSEKIADMQIKHLYLQGAKDCVLLLKKLGVF